MFWPWEVVERDHELQNPTSPAKIRRLGEYLRLTGESRVLDIASGKGGPARILARAFGCCVSGVEVRRAFAETARRLAAEEGLDALIDVRTAEASTIELEPDAFDAALCLGASFVWGTIADAAAALRPCLRPGGSVAIGEPFWRRWPLPEGVAAEGYVGLHETVERLEGAGFRVTGLIAASEDDWDHYESLHWRAIEEWLAGHPDHAGAEEFRDRHDRFRADYFRYQRALLGWAIFVGRKTR
jgi:SAM-dependent methyltransferase